MENRSKSISHRSKEVTVVPPDQYRLRFTREVCDYFIPVPGKQSFLLCVEKALYEIKSQISII